MAKGSKKKNNANQVAAFARYKNENRYAKNRLSKLIKHCLSNPEDTQSAKALRKVEGLNTPYRRSVKSKGYAKPNQKKYPMFPQDNRPNNNLTEQLSVLFNKPLL